MVRTLIRKEGPKGKPRLFLLLVGVADYSKVKFLPAESRKLTGVKVDFEQLRIVWKGQEKKLYREVAVETLSDKEVTSDAVHRLLGKVAKQASPDDLAVFYLGGHGYSQGLLEGARLERGTFTFVGPN